MKIPSATKKRPDTPVKKTPMEEVVQEAESRATPFPPSESSMDSGCVSNLDMENPVADYSEFVNEVKSLLLPVIFLRVFSSTVCDLHANIIE